MLNSPTDTSTSNILKRSDNGNFFLKKKKRKRERDPEMRLSVEYRAPIQKLQEVLEASSMKPSRLQSTTSGLGLVVVASRSEVSSPVSGSLD